GRCAGEVGRAAERPHRGRLLSPQDPLEQVRAIFREEGKDLIEKLSDATLKLEGAEASADRSEIVLAMKRDAHGLKGAAGSMGFKATAELAHALEDVLNAGDEVIGRRETFDVLHHALDALALTLEDRRMPEQ